ncbi:MAG: RNA polymerase sigma factor, partial [Pontiellaceae bacterium]|nr:RNA polymerase sigma factor [Pontiellaceae bacterium]
MDKRLAMTSAMKFFPHLSELSGVLDALIYTHPNSSGMLKTIMKQTDHDIEGLYRAESTSLLRYIRRCGGGSASEDLLQDIFVALLRKPEGLRKARSPKSWMYGVARRLVLSFIRKQSRAAQ